MRSRVTLLQFCEETQEVGFGVGDVEGFARGAGAIPEAAADAGEDIGELSRQSRRRRSSGHHFYL